jgi:heme oxygenase
MVHERLHHIPDFVRLAAGLIDLKSYRGLLARLLGFHAPIEAGIASALGEVVFSLDIRALERAPLLQDDLRALGMGAAEIAALPRTASKIFGTPAEAIGALYVVEGATLGGRQLAPGLDALLGPTVTHGRRFLLAGANPTRPSWREVCATVDRCGADATDMAAMIVGAECTFHKFEQWLTA